MTQTRFRQRSSNAVQTPPVVSPPVSSTYTHSPASAAESRSPGKAYSFAKRALDLTLAGAGLVALSPVLGVVALAVKIDSRGPAFIRQQRVGLDGRTFGCYKFRSMRTDAEAIQEALSHLNERSGPIFKIKDDPRKTRLGRFIRKYSLDELPQLFNVIRGEMSLVGPRPPLPKEVAHYKSHHFRRLEVLPGITGLQQVTARDESDFERWVSLDIEYIESRSFALDLWILLRTLPATVSGRGAS